LSKNLNLVTKLRVSKVRLIVAIFIICSPPYFAECIRIRDTKWQLVADPALEVLGSLDVGNYTRLIGVYSRFDWNHPGPAIFFFLAIPARIGINPALAVAYWTTLFNFFLLTVAVIVIWRSLGRLAALGIGSCLILANVNGVVEVSSAWNPSVALPFFALMLIITMFGWSYRYALLWTTFLGSIVIQLHVGYAIPVAGAVLSLLIARIHRRKNGGTFSDTRELLITFGVNIAVWLLPIWDQFFGSGNFGKILHHFVTDPEDVVGFGRSSRILAFHLLPRAPWNGAQEIVSFTENSQVSALWLLVPGLILLFLTWVSSKRVPQLRFAVMTILVMIFCALISVGRLTGVAGPYMYGWLRITAAILWGTFLFAGLRLVLNYFPNLQQSLQKVFVMLAMITLCISAFTTFNRTNSQKGEMSAVTYLTPFALGLVPAGDEVGFVTTDYLSGIGDGIILQYELHNRHVRMSQNGIIGTEAIAARLGDNRVGIGSSTLEVSIVLGSFAQSFLAEGFVIRASYNTNKEFGNADDINIENVIEDDNVVYLMSRRVLPVKSE
jgi:hypothetical protein